MSSAGTRRVRPGPDVDDLVAEHRSLLTSLQAKDLDRSRQLWQDHLDSAVAEITSGHS